LRGQVRELLGGLSKKDVDNRRERVIFDFFLFRDAIGLLMGFL